jgi:hypothetical protein
MALARCPGQWAVEGAGGLGHLLEAGDTNKNDPNDALSVAVAALRSKARRQVAAEDHAAVLKVWAKRHRDLARARNQVACRLHAVLCDLLARRQQRCHRSSCCPHSGADHTVRPGRGGAA